MTAQHSRPRITKHAVVTHRVLDFIVRDAIDREFYMLFLKDQRMPKLYEMVPEKELKKQAYDLFFKSFYSILEEISTPVSKGKGKGVGEDNGGRMTDIRLYWYKTYYKVEPYEIEHHALKSLGYDDNVDYDDIKPVRINFNAFLLYFYNSGTKYTVPLTERIRTIVDYVTTMARWTPHLEEARNMKYKTVEERTHDGMIEWDMYNYTKTVAQEISKGLVSDEKFIWGFRDFRKEKTT